MYPFFKMDKLCNEIQYYRLKIYNYYILYEKMQSVQRNEISR